MQQIGAECRAKTSQGPGKSFPVNDANHARLAISGATRSEHAGNISPEEEARIKAKAREKLGDKGGSKDDPQRPHREAIARMHPEKLHQHMQDAMAGKHGRCRAAERPTGNGAGSRCS